MLKKFSAAILLLCAVSCIYPKVTIKGKGNVKLTQVDFENLNGWQQDKHREALLAFLNSCEKFAKMPHNRIISGQIGNVTVGDFRDVCEIGKAVKGMSDDQIRNFFENWFKPFLVADRSGSSKGLFTGYYEAELNGSKIKTEKYKYPVYAKPQNLSLDPYLSRKEIEEGALKDMGLELLYVDDKVELFFMHVQGSGRITLPNGSVVRLAFAAKNNQQYTSISNYFTDKNLIPSGKMSSNAIKDWMRQNPDKMDEVMNINDSFIFFKISDQESPIGAQGIPLIAERSLAVDSEIMPYGFPLWVETQEKDKDGNKTSYNHLFIAQDTGSAIRGVVRGDIFFGHGRDAEDRASLMASSGEYYILLPNNSVDNITKKNAGVRSGAFGSAGF